MNTRLEWATLDSGHGKALVARFHEKICWLSFVEHQGEGLREFHADISKMRALQGVEIMEAAPPHARWMKTVQQVLDGALPIDALDVWLEGTDFQIAVWNALRDIPSGQTRTYQQIANAVHKPSAARAVGTAIGQNRIAVLVPCHRVIRSDGSLSGFRWGVARKRALLAQESPQQTLILV